MEGLFYTVIVSIIIAAIICTIFVCTYQETPNIEKGNNYSIVVYKGDKVVHKYDFPIVIPHQND